VEIRLLGLTAAPCGGSTQSQNAEIQWQNENDRPKPARRLAGLNIPACHPLNATASLRCSAMGAAQGSTICRGKRHPIGCRAGTERILLDGTRACSAMANTYCTTKYLFQLRSDNEGRSTRRGAGLEALGATHIFQAITWAKTILIGMKILI